MVTLIDGVILGLAFLLMVGIFLIVMSFYDHKKRTKKILYFQLRNWVKRARELGQSDENMQSTLSQHGWDHEFIIAAMKDNKDTFYK